MKNPQKAEFVVASARVIGSDIQNVWTHVTDVDLMPYGHSAIFKLLGVPRPLRAELTGQGLGARRTAWFDNHKRFVQHVLDWNPPVYLRFSFNADPGFRAGYIFDLSSGPFRLMEGWYRLEETGPSATRAVLGTRYFCSLSRLLLIPFVIRTVLAAYQRFLLRMIQSNCESASRKNAS